MPSSSRGGRRSQRQRRLRLSQTGPAQAFTDAHALCVAAWPPFAHYVWDAAGVHLERHVSHGMTIAEAVADLCDVDITPDPVTAVGDAAPDPSSLTGPLDALPDEAFQPDDHSRLPLVVDMAQAVAACMPALVTAILDDALPADAAGDPRQALVDVYRRYRHADSAYDNARREQVLRMLTTGWDADPAAPVELGGRWQWMVRVVGDGGMGPMLATDGMPLRCFSDLDQARRFAVLSTDFSREVAGEPRDSAFMELVERIVASGPAGVSVNGDVGDRQITGAYTTLLTPNPAA